MSHWFGICFHATSAFRVFIFTHLMVSIDFLVVYVKVVLVKDVSDPPNLALGTHQCVGGNDGAREIAISNALISF